MGDQDFAQAMCIIKVICYIVIAASAYTIAFTKYEYFGNTLAGTGMISTPASYGTAGGNRFYTETQQSMFNNPEPPVFWNLGDVESTNAALMAAASEGVDNSYKDNASGFSNRSLATGGNINHKLPAALVGL